MERTFPARSSSVRAARRYAVDAVGNVPHAVADAVAIAVSELATNCVLHAETEFAVSVVRTPGQVRIAVSDAGYGVPTVRSPAASDVSGRGLFLVGELADDWGVVSPTDRPGKSVWFSMRLPTPADAELHEADH